ncbi:nuclease-related domain-containing protein [Rummeliibacillus pycnus]|uniref:nuclease-related domain-containing protein n=1 Tax=Rummeliibacillus pycnus TaxID=101070 RepID=UPI003D2DDD28
MIVKPYSETHYLEALNNLIRRLVLSNPKKEELENEYKRIKAGDIGEKVVMESLEQFQLPYDFFIFHNLSLLLESKIQIDVLFLTPYYVVIFEVKNIKGDIELRHNPRQLVRTLSNGQVHVFNSPEPQLEEYVHQLKRFFLNKGTNIPVYGAVIFPFTSSFIKQTSNKTTILLKNEIKPFLRNIPIKTSFLTNKGLEHMKGYFLDSHTEFSPYPLIDRYNIPREDILNGVLCKKCGELGMKKFSHYWFCPSCHFKNVTAHEEAIYDYFKIINHTITNTKCREFLGISNPNQFYRMIKKMNLNSVGKNRHTIYSLPEHRK